VLAPLALAERGPLRAVLLFALVAAAAAWLDLRESLLGHALAPAIGPPEASGTYGRIAVGIVLGALITANLGLVRILPFAAQVVLIWAELLALFLAFFYSFDLSYGFIAERLEFLILQGAVTTIYVSLIAIVIASMIALAAALARLSRSGVAYGVATFYISFFRGTPLLLQVYLIYLGLPQLGLTVDAVPSGVAALSLCYGAYMAEIFRAGIQGVPRGQTEAALALGLRRGHILQRIVLPQAMRLIVPPTGSQFIAMLKDSSLVSVMGVWELMFLARTQGRSEFKHLEMLITAAVIYWVISMGFELVQARLERHFGRGVQR